MKKLLMTVTVLALTGATVGLAANEGHTHTTLGTVEQVEEDRLDVKSTDGQTVSFTLTDETNVERGGKTIDVEALKKGERVAVESEERDGNRFAVGIRAGSDTRAQTYSCPMHPEVTSDEKGRCPKCKMFLEPKKTQ